MLKRKKRSSGGHWGVFYLSDSLAGNLVTEPHPRDPNPTNLVASAVAASQHLDSRVMAPMVRKGWLDMPAFENFWEAGDFEFPRPARPIVLMEDFRNDPKAKPLKTASGKIEKFSETIDAFGYEDCPGHPVWLEPAEWLGSDKIVRHLLHLISNQPKTRLHGQLDSGPISVESKIAGREPVMMNPADTAFRGLVAGDIVRIFNGRGACLAGLVISDSLRKGVVQLSTGAWYDPLEPGVPDTVDRHGNPNMLTLDKGTSQLTQAPISQTTLVEIERYDGVLPEITVHSPPKTI